MIPRLLGRASAHLMRPRSLALVGGSALALALGVVALPGLFPESTFRPLSAVLASPATILLFGVVAGLLALRSVRDSASSGDDRDRWVPETTPERAYYDEYRTVGSEVDAVFDVNPDETDELYARRRDARGRVREVAVSVLAADENVSRREAAERIRAGTWTDDPRAAAFLGGQQFAPLRTRIRDWASGERFERWATHAVAEIEARSGGEERAATARREGRR